MIDFVIIAIVFITVALLGLWGFFRGWIRSLIGLGTTIVSLVVAIFTAKPIAGLLTDSVTKPILSLIPEDVLNIISESSPTLNKMVLELPSSLITPLVFLAMFVLVSLLLLIGYFIATPFIDKKKKGTKRPTYSKIIGMSISIIQGLALMFAFVVVLGGSVGVVGNINDAVYAIDNEQLTGIQTTLNDANEKYLEPVSNNFIVKAYMACGGEALYNSYSSVIIDGEVVMVDKELKLVLPFIFDFLEITQSEEPSVSKIAALSESLAAFEKSEFSSKIAHELLANAANKWLSDSGFLGIKNPAIGTEYEEAFNQALEVIKNSKPEEIVQNVKDLLASMGINVPDDLPDTDIKDFEDIFGTDTDGNGVILPMDTFE